MRSCECGTGAARWGGLECALGKIDRAVWCSVYAEEHMLNVLINNKQSIRVDKQNEC